MNNQLPQERQREDNLCQPKQNPTNPGLESKAWLLVLCSQYLPTVGDDQDEDGRRQSRYRLRMLLPERQPVLWIRPNVMCPLSRCHRPSRSRNASYPTGPLPLMANEDQESLAKKAAQVIAMEN
mmetsp:Transcript_2297/g.4197  ORF Transcript_2297/g.4197 Transcript_2297/m.4197 type:complete len:124 (-) Transcript_2297:945-1316(-)